ncbi:MAG: S-adenosylmethionine decarboxylase [Desulfovermiculus sp.]
MPYRQRLIIECFKCKKNMESAGFAHTFLVKLTKALDMKLLVPPVVLSVPVPSPAPSLKTNDAGVTGFVIWMESGTQIHTWPRIGLVTLDIYSCKKFGQSIALDMARKAFAPQHVDFLAPDLGGGT